MKVKERHVVLWKNNYTDRWRTLFVIYFNTPVGRNENNYNINKSQ
jgi:hypothetical protein